MKKIFLIILLTQIINFAQTTETDTKINFSAAYMISITVGGSFIVNGSFPASMTERVDQFVTRIYNESIVKIEARKRTNINYQYFVNEEILGEFALRNIVLKHADGTEEKIDLAKFRINGDYKNNPYLKNDDILVFPVLDLDLNFISIEGAVNSPGRYQYVDGDHLSDILELAQGINKAYENIDKIKISRLSYDGEKEEIIEATVNSNPALQAGDRIVIVAEESQKKDFRVNILGEVKKVGYVPITKSSTTLREVITNAGGFTEKADLDRAELIRSVNVFKNPFFSQEFENLMMSRMANISIEDSLSFVIDNKLRFARGNGLIDFAKIMDSTSSEGNFLVKDEDVIFVPEKINLVYVFGQVGAPGYVKYIPDENFKYYIAKAGGIGATARGEIYLIKGQSRTWLEVDEDTKVKIEPGDYIWVPKEPLRTFDYYVSRFGSYVSILGGVATVILLIMQLRK
ncbi:MAG: SLBB domain-containing protein [Ignavibacteriaceae bacterium]|nr:SLBB domain-containing protein [Ignavibacteriaceae bacterium]